MYIAVFLVGFAAGIAWQRLMISLSLQDKPDTICHYCQWSKRKYF